MDTIGRYKVLEEIGRGGMGVVLKAHDPAIDRFVAIKRVSIPPHLDGKKKDEFFSRFLREARAAGRLSHPHILTIFDIGVDNDLPYITMEYLTGITVEELLERKGVLSVEDTRTIISQTCEALDYAHNNGIIHRDIKPSNIFFQSTGSIKVMDFGIAHLSGGDATTTSQILGSPSYISPEYVKGDMLDRRADIFAVGVVLYQCLTGEKPFTGDNVAAVLQKIVSEDPAPPSHLRPSLPPGCDLVVMKALQKNPAQRYQLAGDLARDFAGVEDLRSRAGNTVEIKSPGLSRESFAHSKTERIFQEATTSVKRVRNPRPAGLWQRMKDFFH